MYHGILPRWRGLYPVPTFLNSLHNLIYYTFRIFQNIIIPESQNLKAFTLQPLAPLIIFLQYRILVMLPAISLYYQHLVQAHEIYDVASYRMLTAEFESFHLSASQK